MMIREGSQPRSSALDRLQLSLVARFLALAVRRISLLNLPDHRASPFEVPHRGEVPLQVTVMPIILFPKKGVKGSKSLISASPVDNF